MTDSGPHVARAPHFDGGGRTESRLVTAAELPGAPVWLAQISNGVRDLDVDTLATASHAGQATPSQLEGMRSELRPAARLLSMFTSEQELRLEEEVRTGKLIRVVVRAGPGAAFCFSVVPQQHIVGFQLGLDPADRAGPVHVADEIMAELATRLRDDVGLSSQHPGGLAEPRSRPSSAEVGPHVTGRADGECWAGALAAVSPGVLHWAGLVEQGQLVATADHLGDPALAQYFGLITPEARRKFYGELATEAHVLMARLGRAVHPLLPGPVHSLVLDVEQGAIAIHRLGARDYLVGVTLDQEQVAVAERMLSELAAVH